ncbi:hypothetical protein DFQ27_000004 [Actinomortierella ambigua]|uniref:Fcf2 pre-rRNA processing C-terminal domain-containing protein n=1 Tax=Actinomortierella ambigua TaxID=1343610 RepID=A0A9P6UD96_9FUNG|nr:hypothetical protein DFQ27_000004 [Actinomortierella ambigua]
MVTTRNRAKAAAAAGTNTPVDLPVPTRTPRAKRSSKKAPLAATEDTTSDEMPSETTSVADSIDNSKPTVEDTLAQEPPAQEDKALDDDDEDEIMQEDQAQESDDGSDSDSSSASSDEEEEESEDEGDDEDEDELTQLLLKAQQSLKGKKKTSPSSEATEGKEEPMFNFPKLQSQMDAKTYLKQENGRVKIAAETVAVVDRGEGSKSKKSQTNKDGSSGALETVERNMNAHKVHVSHKEKKEAREKTTGKGWFDMPQQVLTPELKRDLQILKLRNVLDPKRFYKREEKGKPKFPKYFQVGTVIEGNTEFYSSRLTKKERATTITGEVMKDLAGRDYYKRKFDEIQETKQSGGKRFYKKGDGKKKRNLGWKK